MVNAISINDEYAKRLNDFERSFGSQKAEEQSIFLEEKLQAIEDEQGLLGKTWNGIKELTTLGVSQNDCEKMLRKYKVGEISFEEAINYLDEYKSKQETMSGLLSNIVTGIGAITVATTTAMTGGLGAIGWGLAFAKGAPIGAAIKASVNFIDRATNDVEGDAFDAKQIAKDAISGALTGATSAVASGVGAGIRSGQFGTTVLNGMKCGAICGSMSGACGYLTDVTFGDEDFEFGELTTNTLISGATSATVGAFVGASMYGGASLMGTAGKEVAKTTGQVIAQDSTSSSARKILGTEVKQLINA